MENSDGDRFGKQFLMEEKRTIMEEWMKDGQCSLFFDRFSTPSEKLLQLLDDD